METLDGRCLCGDVKWHYEGVIGRNLVCHCESCRRATSSAYGAFLALEPSGLTWRGDINHYESSPNTYRGFCCTCGTRLYFASDRWPGEMHVHAATLISSADYRFGLRGPLGQSALTLCPFVKGSMRSRGSGSSLRRHPRGRHQPYSNAGHHRMHTHRAARLG